MGSSEPIWSTSPFLEGTSGDILDLNLPAAPVGVPNLGIANFLTFAADPSLTFTLDLIAEGPYTADECFDAPAAGQTCTFPGSPFGLTNISSDSSGVQLLLFGTASDGSGDIPSPWRGTFTAHFDVPFQEVTQHRTRCENVSDSWCGAVFPSSLTLTGAPLSSTPGFAVVS